MTSYIGGCAWALVASLLMDVFARIGWKWSGGRGEEGVVGAFSIAAKLDRLFRQVRAAGQAEPSYMAVAEAIRAQQDVPISHTYIWQLRTGRRDNPTIQHLTALATYFGVPVSYFLDDEQTRRVDAQLDLLQSIRDAGVTEIALRAADVSPRGRETISELIRKVWESEQPPA